MTTKKGNQGATQVAGEVGSLVEDGRRGRAPFEEEKRGKLFPSSQCGRRRRVETTGQILRLRVCGVF